MSLVNYSIDHLEQTDDQRTHVRKTLNEIKSRFGIKGKKIVEIGCGLAGNLQQFRADNEVHGVDGLPEVVEAVRKLGISAEVANLEEGRLPFPDKVFDVVLCIDVLEHINNAGPLTAEMRRIVADDGLFIFNVPNHLTLKGRLKLLRGEGMDMHKFFPEYDDWDNPHIRFFTHSGFHRFLKHYKLEVAQDMSEYMTLEGLERGRPSPTKIAIKRALARRYPALFLGGFFVVARKAGV